ncbi:hypothetical protein A9P82_14065 [Arachidicoccus ginsenosidimutans]|uniref:TonB-dependent receptor plug domain-containing protein n=1 Tax=Arachidicoccus sp. BS20 TaxID=1850526 RepID=UPI0007F16ED2|nr:TonB-dependent receptor plug domain-containing protein [Arachidicoccus sp. BS20]ANI90319.1 hypothetical protein A9P82_14065 [Arachidicoccus sp. BS20]
MNNEEINIDLIKDYFAGKLDAKAMHALEKRALEDPFLAEAMEGFFTYSNNVPYDLNELQTRLKNRVSKKSFNLKPWLIAASIVLLLGIGVFFVLNNSNNKTQNIAKEIVQNANIQQPVVINNDTQSSVVTQTDTTSKIVALRKKEMKIIRDTFPSPYKKVFPEKELILAKNNTFNNKSFVAANIIIPSKKISDSSFASTLQGKVAGIVVDTTTANLNDVVVVGYGTQKKESITGAVAATDNHMMIRGNNSLDKTAPLILIDGSSGNLDSINPRDIASFNILKDSKATAIYGSRGANGVILITTKKRNVNNLSFAKLKKDTSIVHPQISWKKFKDYVENAVKKSDTTGTKGTVILSFSVLPDGRLTDFKIIKGLSYERDQQAIDILKNGPLWNYNSISHTGFYTIEF